MKRLILILTAACVALGAAADPVPRRVDLAHPGRHGDDLRHGRRRAG